MSESSVPVAIVPTYVAGRHWLKRARGFSIGELKEAGLERSHDGAIGIRVDSRRSTTHAHNVSSLKGFKESSKTETRAQQPVPEGTSPESEGEVKSDLRKKKTRAQRSGDAEKEQS